jgi:hypothetical protein
MPLQHGRAARVQISHEIIVLASSGRCCRPSRLLQCRKPSQLHQTQVCQRRTEATVVSVEVRLFIAELYNPSVGRFSSPEYFEMIMGLYFFHVVMHAGYQANQSACHLPGSG